MLIYYKKRGVIVNISLLDTLPGVIIPRIPLGVTDGIVTQTVPAALDGVSAAIFVQFPLGSQIRSTVYVSEVARYLEE